MKKTGFNGKKALGEQDPAIGHVVSLLEEIDLSLSSVAVGAEAAHLPLAIRRVRLFEQSEADDIASFERVDAERPITALDLIRAMQMHPDYQAHVWRSATALQVAGDTLDLALTLERRP